MTAEISVFWLSNIPCWATQNNFTRNKVGTKLSSVTGTGTFQPFRSASHLWSFVPTTNQKNQPQSKCVAGIDTGSATLFRSERTIKTNTQASHGIGTTIRCTTAFANNRHRSCIFDTRRIDDASVPHWALPPGSIIFEWDRCYRYRGIPSNAIHPTPLPIPMPMSMPICMAIYLFWQCQWSMCVAYRYR